MSFTQGDWGASGKQVGAKWSLRNNSWQAIVAFCPALGIPEGEARGNAVLIAEAPRLYASLERLHRKLKVLGYGGADVDEAENALAIADGHSYTTNKP